MNYLTYLISIQMGNMQKNVDYINEFEILCYKISSRDDYVAKWFVHIKAHFYENIHDRKITNSIIKKIKYNLNDNLENPFDEKPLLFSKKLLRKNIKSVSQINPSNEKKILMSNKYMLIMDHDYYILQIKFLEGCELLKIKLNHKLEDKHFIVDYLINNISPTSITSIIKKSVNTIYPINYDYIRCIRNYTNIEFDILEEDLIVINTLFDNNITNESLFLMGYKKVDDLELEKINKLRFIEYDSNT